MLCKIIHKREKQVLCLAHMWQIYHFGESTFILRDIGGNLTLSFHFSMKIMLANRIAPDVTPRFAASHQGLFCLPLSHKKDASLIWVKNDLCICPFDLSAFLLCCLDRFQIWKGDGHLHSELETLLRLADSDMEVKLKLVFLDLHWAGSYIPNFKCPATQPLWLCRLVCVLYLVRNPGDRFAHDEVQLLVYYRVLHTIPYLFEPRCEKNGLRGFRPGPTQTRLYNYTSWLEAWNFVYRK